MKIKPILWFALIFMLFSIFANSARAESNFKFYFFGIDLEWVKDADLSDIGCMVLGAAASVATHELSHGLYAESTGADWKFIHDFPRIGVHTDKSVWSDHQHRWMGRAGFIGQLLGGTLLTLSDETRDWYFTRGWVGITDIGLASYPFRHKTEGDFYNIKSHGGNAELEYSLMGLWSLHNTLRVKW